MAPDYLKLFMDKRLTPSEPHHLEIIKGRLASMKIEDPSAYKEYSAYYKIDLDVIIKEPTVEVEKPKRGRKPKVS